MIPSREKLGEGGVQGRLEDRAILVTGAAGAIGGATAKRLSQEGARTMLADRDRAGCDRLAEEIAATGAPRPATFAFDAADPVSCAELIGAAAGHAGRLDGLCNIAGVYGKARSEDVSDADWAMMLQVNLTSSFTLTREAIPHLLRSRGSVVNTASLAALEGLAYSAAYAAAKAGVIALTKSLAAEFATAGLRFNVVCPGGIRSSMSSVAAVHDADPELAFRRSKLKGFEGGLGEPRDVAAAFAYLLSEDARFVSGSVLVVDGAQFLV